MAENIEREAKIVSRPWTEQDLIDDLQLLIDEEPDNYLNDKRTTLCMARDYLKHYFAADVVELQCRCQDCTHNKPELALREGGIWCNYWGTDPDPDGWCYKGERRADNAAD